MKLDEVVKGALVVTAAALVLACGGGGLSGEYTNKDGTFTYNFSGGKVEVDAKVMGTETQHQLAYEFADGKLKVWEPSQPDAKQVLAVDAEGCFDVGMFAGKVCPKGAWKS